jgi:hypothetical protein
MVGSSHRSADQDAPGVRWARSSMNPTRIPTARPRAVRSEPTWRQTSGPDARSARTGVRMSPPGRVCSIHV